MASMSILEIEKQFPQIIHKVEAGEEIILEKSGQPIARIIPIKKRGERILGREKGKIWMSDDFTAPLPHEMLKEFYK